MRASVIFVCLLMTCVSASAQPDRFFDRVEVDFDKPVTINTNQTVPPGHYTLQQVRIQGHPRVFRVIDSAGRNVGMTAGAASAMYKSASTFELPGQTQVLLKEIGDKRYLDKIWFEGQNHGYDFSLAEDARAAMSRKSSSSASSNKGSGAQMAGTVTSTPIVREIIVLAVPVVAAMPAGGGNQSAASGMQGASTGSNSTSTTASESSTQRSSMNDPGMSGSTGAANSGQNSGQGGTTGAAAMSAGSSGQGSSSTPSSQPSATDSVASPSGMSSATGQSGRGTEPASAGSGAVSTTGTASQQPIEIVGCVTGPYGGSYMLSSTSDGRRYQLEGDYDNIRESLGRTVTIWGLPRGGGNSTAAGSTGTPSPAASSGGSSAAGSQSSGGSVSSGGSNAEPPPVIVSVQRMRLVSERCDEPQARR